MQLFFEKMKRSEMVTAIVIAVIGLILLIWPGMSVRVACRGIGILLLIFGLVQIVPYLFSPQKDYLMHGMFVLGVILAVIGAWITWKPQTVIAALPIIAGIFIVLHGIQNLVQAVQLQKQSYPRWQAAVVLGLITLLLGIILICNPFAAVETLIRFIGFFLLYDGISDAWIQSKLTF